ncbi:MAG TPA: 3'-5' exonuclease [Polyangiaceae bacterium]|jgi:DNA polymerase-3 subunit epsilon
MRPTGDIQSCFPTGRHYPGIAHLLRIVASGLADEFGGDIGFADIPLVAIDTETTGRDPAVDRIVEIACVIGVGGRVVERRSWLVNPGCPIPKEAFDVHGICDDDVRDKPSFAEIAAELAQVLEGRLPVAYNAEFDKEFLAAELARLATAPARPAPAARRQVEWVDPLVWARELQHEEKSRALVDVCGRLGIELVRAHRAADDAEAALRVLFAFAADVRVPRTYAAFVQEQKRLARDMDEERQRWRRPS